MEFLLNLTWLLLALPACWLWRASRSAPAGRKVTALQCLLALGCVLVILFPVISATDDLHAMRAEIDESPASKRSIRHTSADKSAAWKCRTSPALATSRIPFFTSEFAWIQLITSRLSVPVAPTIEQAARAPPHSLLA
jgi:hypothetical protein